MLTLAIDAYLAIRRSAGFGLRVTEGFLRNYAQFATARGDTHIRSYVPLYSDFRGAVCLSIK